MKIQEMSKHLTVIEGLTEEQAVNYIEANVAYTNKVKGSSFVTYYHNHNAVAEYQWNAGSYNLVLF